MAPKIFATGATGYIGGTALHLLTTTYPDYEITVLVRDEAKAAAVSKKYPHFRTLIGDLDSVALIESASATADIILHFANADHVPAAKAIISGASKRSAGTAYIIHTSGTGLLSDAADPSTLGKLHGKVYDDIEDVAEITSFPDEGHLHRDVDRVVIAGNGEHVKTAIVCPPVIYGHGSGVGNTRSIQVPALVSETLKRKEAFKVSDGANIWGCVHVQDLARFYMVLVEEALKSGGGRAVWGPEGYYFVESGEIIWGELSKSLAAKLKAQGLLETENVASISTADAASLHPYGPLLWGSTSRSRASRARKSLGWKPVESSVEENLDADIQREAEALGLL
ncbi:NAD(P)-binding protein [Choiromyces venosus 120613-1]|uniref:NAD(P)-binding protein n=1 Tax=Choiromyces venosus 120613-1 TaxID=1336337 RepID=A0A3N4JBF1_9PEZI|nr:NAD(P)-binding protein [Choiromyces venosus 120613-1]